MHIFIKVGEIFKEIRDGKSASCNLDDAQFCVNCFQGFK